MGRVVIHIDEKYLFGSMGTWEDEASYDPTLAPNVQRFLASALGGPQRSRDVLRVYWYLSRNWDNQHGHGEDFPNGTKGPAKSAKKAKRKPRQSHHHYFLDRIRQNYGVTLRGFSDEHRKDSEGTIPWRIHHYSEEICTLAASSRISEMIFVTQDDLCAKLIERVKDHGVATKLIWLEERSHRIPEALRESVDRTMHLPISIFVDKLDGLRL